MMPVRNRALVLVAMVALVATACTSSDSGGGLSEEDAAAGVDAVVASFREVAEQDGFSEDTDDDDEDTDFECEGFEEFTNDDDTDPIAEAEFSVTDGGEPEAVGVGDDGQLDFEGGEVSGGVEASAIDESDLDAAIAALDSVLDDRDAFADCFEESLASVVSEDQEDSPVELQDFAVEVEVDDGSTGDQEIVVELDGSFTVVAEEFFAEFPLRGQFRIIRIGQVGLQIQMLSFGDVDTSTLEPAVDAAIEEFEAQFG